MNTSRWEIEYNCIWSYGYIVLDNTEIIGQGITKQWDRRQKQVNVADNKQYTVTLINQILKKRL